MKTGICTQEITRDNVQAVFDAAAQYGFEQVQFNMLSVCGIETPEEIDPLWVDEILAAKSRTQTQIVAINGVFNMIDPDPKARERGFRGFSQIAGICRRIGCPLVSLNTGTFSTQSMWHFHPDNNTEDAWRQMLDMMERVLTVAEECGVDVGVEPEASNVVNSADKAARLIREMQSDRIKIIMDCANLFHPGEAKKENVAPVMEHAFELLGDRVALAHGKDIEESDGIVFTAAGQGIVDFALFRSLLDGIGYEGSMILHGFHQESEIARSIQYLERF